MIIVGTIDCAPYILDNVMDRNNLIFLNLSSLREGYERVAILPPSNIDFLDDEYFDSYYSDFIFNNDLIFLEFMKIIMNLYSENDICLLVSRNDHFDRITESLLKIIQQRYGCNSYIVNIPEDALMLGTTIVKDDGFSMSGLAALDMDKERYSYLTTSIQLKQEGKIQ